MAIYTCSICETEFDETKEGTEWEKLPSDWTCHVCESGKSLWRMAGDAGTSVSYKGSADDVPGPASVPAKTFDEFETYMADIHIMAETGQSILNKDDLKNKVAWLRDVSGGKPIGIKFAAGNIEADLEVAIYAQPDFITIDGRAGATGAAPKFVKSAASIPTIFAIYRARKYLDSHSASDISLIATGGLRISPDFAKALALGATAVAIGTTALIAIGCRQYRICNTGKCPMGITTHDPALRKNLEVDRAAKRLENFLRVTNNELKDFARLTGNGDVHKLSIADLCTTNSEISEHTDIEHV